MIICSMGGGFSSTALLPRVLLSLYDAKDLHFVTCVLPNEHPSMWELYDAVEKELSISVTYIAYDKDAKYKIVDKIDRTNTIKLATPFDIFDTVKFIGNSRIDPCSRILKRETIRHYITKNFPITDIDKHMLAIGISEDEIERLINIKQNWETLGYIPIFPLRGFDLSGINKFDKIKQWYNVEMPLYKLDFEHNNCGGACVKAGQRQWAKLWFYFPVVYRDWETRELQWRVNNSSNNTILTKVVGGVKTSLTLKEFRETYLEPAVETGAENTFLERYINSLPGSPACAWCAAI